MGAIVLIFLWLNLLAIGAFIIAGIVGLCK
jgi:hypothetical protein